jgi:hypothetical protein
VTSKERDPQTRGDRIDIYERVTASRRSGSPIG